MKILSEKENLLKNNVRDILAVDPLVSVRRTQELMEQRTGHPISDKYLAKLMHKVRRQTVVMSDRKKMNDRLAEVRERHRILIQTLNRTIFWKQDYLQEYGIRRPDYRERHAAIKLVAKMEIDLFRAELAAGAYEDRRAAIAEILQQGILPTTLQEQVVAVFRQYKLQTPTAEAIN